MTPLVRIRIDGRDVDLPSPPGATIAGALLSARHDRFGLSPTGRTRFGFCGVGVCFECRVTIDGVPGRRACLEPLRPGIVVSTEDVG